MLRRLFMIVFLWLFTINLWATPDPVALAVWANEAIIATYTYNHDNFLARQAEIAKYFTADGWIAYSNALNDAKLPEMVKNNAYTVSAVATLPPTVSRVDRMQWQAVMPILVLYKNPQYQQKQSLQVTIRIIEQPNNGGTRGLAIASLQSTIIEPPCECKNQSTSPNGVSN